MFTIQTLNKISSIGLDLLSRETYEIATEIINPDAILVRSQNMLDMDFQPKLKAIARAGAGVNNIPIDKCTEKGIVVFNTPGANANAVKELVLLSLFISSRKVVDGINWVQSIKNEGKEVPKLVEKGKSKFEGPEIQGKRLGVIGLGAIGVMVANSALSLGMEVIGFDPFISIDAAWELSSNVIKAASIEQLISTSDYISIHVPFSDKTKEMINTEKINLMKKGVRIINFSRSGLVSNKDILEGISSGKVAKYITDFPEAELIGVDNIITIPHLGASTPESEENCAKMASTQLKNFMELGNIKNSVNFPNCELLPTCKSRIIAAHDNIPNMFGQITSLIAENKINIGDMISKHKNTIGYTILDIDDNIPETVIDKLKSIVGVRMVRVINNLK